MAICEAKCPEAHRKAYHETDTCDVNDKMCLLESGTECSTYQEYLAKYEEGK